MKEIGKRRERIAYTMNGKEETDHTPSLSNKAKQDNQIQCLLSPFFLVLTAVDITDLFLKTSR